MPHDTIVRQRWVIFIDIANNTKNKNLHKWERKEITKLNL